MSEKVEAILQYIALAVFAGAIGHIQRNTANGKPVLFWRVVMEAAGAGLVGYILMLICLEVGLSSNWTGAVVGTGGWLGASASIRIIERYVFRKLGVTNDDFDRADRRTPDVEGRGLAQEDSPVDRVRSVVDRDRDDGACNQLAASGEGDGTTEPTADERL